MCQIITSITCAVVLISFINGQQSVRPNEILGILDQLLLSQTTTTTSSDLITVEFFLCNVTTRTNLTEENLHLIKTSDPMVFIIHGWSESANRPWYQSMITAYTKLGTFTIIAVDWSLPASKPYTTSVKNTRKVGAVVGDFIVKLTRKYGTSLNEIHVVGHSLGGHVSGFTGKRVLRLLGRRIRRITALDPAGPLFDGYQVPDSERLSRLDADFVDVIHTDGGYFGMGIQFGTVDFFPNMGTHLQPGCPEAPEPFDVIGGIFCSHARSVDYFIESINSKGFVGKLCTSGQTYAFGFCNGNIFNIMGQHVNPNVIGGFHLNTNGKSPYAKNNGGNV